MTTRAGRTYPKKGPQVSQWSSNADMRSWMAHMILNVRAGKHPSAPRGADKRRLIMGKADVKLATRMATTHGRNSGSFKSRKGTWAKGAGGRFVGTN